MAKKRVNKNMVAFLTVMGIALSVAVVAVATYQSVSKDPEVYARNARDLEQRGETERAINRYIKAYRVKNETKYLLDAARCAYRVGRIGGAGAIGMLIQAHTQSPNDPQVLEQLLEYYWDFRKSAEVWPDIRKYSERLLEIDAEHVEALVYRSAALANMEDDDNADLSTEVLARAIELAPNNPLVALARAQQEITAAREAVKQASERGLEPLDVPEVRAHLGAALDILQIAIKEHPDNSPLVIRAVGLLGMLQRGDDATDALRAGIVRMPDDPDLHLALGRSLTTIIQKRRGESDAAQNIKALDQEARKHLRRAVELEPALYSTHMSLARLTWQDKDSTVEGQADLIRRGDAALKVLTDGLAASVGLKSPRASLNWRAHMALYMEAFELALEYSVRLEDPQRKSELMDRAQAIHEQSVTAYPEWPATHFMQGQFHRIAGDVRAAIQAFERADSKTDGGWRQVREQLADLYRQDQQYGWALSTLESVIEAYVNANQEVPLRWYVNKADLLQRLNKPQRALHLVEDQLRRHPDHVTLLQLRVPSLRALGRTDEAQLALAQAEKAQLAQEGQAGGSGTASLTTASLAASLGDYAGAETKLRAILDRNPENMAAVNLLVQVLTADERREVAKQVVSDLRGKVTDPALQRYLAGYEVVLGTTDAKERDAGLLKLIETTPDLFERYGELYNFYVAEERRDLDKAEHYLAEMIKLRPDSTALIDKQFGVALMRKDFAAAERHAVRLAAANADHCEGAMYRGRLELARDNPDMAVAELRSAERLLPSNSFLKTLIAQAVVRSSSGSLDEAVEVLKNAIEINPLNFQAHALMFRLYIQLGDRDSAIEHLLTASKLDPSDPFIKSNKQLVDEENDPQAGIVRREELRAAQPDDVANLLRLADLYRKTDDSVRAEECFALVLEKEPGNWNAVQMTAGFFGDAGRREDAEGVLRDYESRVEGAEKIWVYFMLSQLAERLNDHGGAYEHLRHAQQMAAATTDTRKQRQVVVEASFRLAEFCSRHKLSEEMIESYRAALQQLDPSDTALRQRAKLRIIDAFLATNRLGEAEAETAAFTREYPEDTRGMVVQAELMVRRKQIVEAIEAFTRVIGKVPDPNHQIHAYARYRRGVLYHDQGNYGAARADLLAAKRSKPQAFGLKHRMALAAVYESTNEIASAEAELREIIPLAADYRTPADMLVNLYRRTGQFERGQQIAREYMNKYPQRTFWPFALGSMLMARGEFSAAVEPLKRAVELSLEKNRDAAHHMYWQLLTAMVRAGRFGEAIDVYEKIETGSTPSVRARAAEAYYRNGQRDRALSVLEEAMREATDQEWSELLNVARVGDHFLPDDAALAFFKRLADQQKQGPKSAQYDTVYSRVLMLTDRANEARTLVESVIERTAAGASWRLPALEMLAELTFDDPEGQRRAYEKMLAEDADNVIAANNLAVLLSEKLNRPKEALKYAERAHDLVSQNPDILDTLGWVRFLNGDLEKAEQSLLAAIRMSPRYLPAHYHLGRLYAERGLDAKARSEYEQALEIARRAGNAEYEKKIDEAMKKLP